MSKYMNRVLEIDWDAKWARVEPGTVLDDLRNRAEERHLTFGPDPATHQRNTLGGMIGNNSCGMHAQMAGKVEENTEALEILTYDGLRMWVGPTTDAELEAIIAAGGRRGEIYARLKNIRDTYADQIRKKFPHIPRLVSGYPLQQLLPEYGFNVARALVGTENTCVTILEAKLRLVHSPPCRTLVVFGFADIFTAGDQVPFCNTHNPIALEGIDSSMFTYMHDKGMTAAKRSGSGKSGNQGSARRPKSPTFRISIPAGKTRPSRPRMSATTCAISRSCSTSTTTPHRCTGTLGKAVFTAASISICTRPLASRHGSGSWMRRRIWS